MLQPRGDASPDRQQLISYNIASRKIPGQAGQTALRAVPASLRVRGRGPTAAGEQDGAQRRPLRGEVATAEPTPALLERQQRLF
jgi:hypothetical protein